MKENPHMPGDHAARRDARGILVVRGEEVRARLNVRPGYWRANLKSDVIVVASTYGDGQTGRIFGTSLEGQGVAGSEAGFMCDGGAKFFVAASTIAMRDTMRKLGEALGNSERLGAANRMSKKR